MDKKKKILIIVITILMITIGVTFAYFMAKTGDGVNSKFNLTSDTVDDLKFSVSKDLSLTINQFNFGEGVGNLSDEVVATASLKANSTKKTATYNYYVYFQIESNGYVYTTTGKLPEVVLSITGPNGEVTSIEGLSYVSATSADGTVVKGFDITELGNSVIKIADNYEITSNSSTNYTNQDWTFKVTFINLSTNQLGNDGKSLVGKVLIQKDEVKETIAMVCSNGQNLSDCIKSMNGKDDTLYYHDSNLENGAGDNSYRYAGASDLVNNYVCFGSDEATCPVDNLYRIIGVFDGKVKLIKADYAKRVLLETDGDYYSYVYKIAPYYKGSLSILNIGGYYWNFENDKTINNGNGTNTWSTSLLNKTNLNTNYLNNIGSKWSNMIDTTTWNVGGNTVDKIRNVIPSVSFQNEIVSPASDATYEAKVGLMYASDYRFAADPSAWTSISSISSKNWMYMGLAEWTISPVFSQSYSIFVVHEEGFLFTAFARNDRFVRPVSYLKASVKYNQGSGTKDSPIRINL